MSDTMVKQAAAVYVEIEEPSRVTMNGLAQYLGCLDLLYRNMRFKMAARSAELYHLEEVVRDGTPIPEPVIDKMQSILDEIWSELTVIRGAPRTETIDGAIDPSDTFGLNIASISMSSPITITFEGVWPILLIVAAIFSGGHISVGSLKVRLPPLGVGVESMRRALGKPGGARSRQPPRSIKESIEQ